MLKGQNHAKRITSERFFLKRYQVFRNADPSPGFTSSLQDPDRVSECRTGFALCHLASRSSHPLRCRHLHSLLYKPRTHPVPSRASLGLAKEDAANRMLHSYTTPVTRKINLFASIARNHGDASALQVLRRPVCSEGSGTPQPTARAQRSPAAAQLLFRRQQDTKPAPAGWLFVYISDPANPKEACS